MAGENAYYHGKAQFNRIMSTFESQPSSANPAHATAPCYFFNRRNKLSVHLPLC